MAKIKIIHISNRIKLLQVKSCTNLLILLNHTQKHPIGCFENEDMSAASTTNQCGAVLMRLNHLVIYDFILSQFLCNRINLQETRIRLCACVFVCEWCHDKFTQPLDDFNSTPSLYICTELSILRSLRGTQSKARSRRSWGTVPKQSHIFLLLWARFIR